jgi:DNA-binding transcriptional ArsR family regulator
METGKSMADSTDTELVANILAALGSSTRLELVKRLSMAETFGGQSICELAAKTGLTRQAITKHLEVLGRAGLVSRKKPGRATWFELKSEPISRAIEALSAIAKQRARSQQRLKLYKERLLG